MLILIPALVFAFILVWVYAKNVSSTTEPIKTESVDINRVTESEGSQQLEPDEFEATEEQIEEFSRQIGEPTL